MERDNLGIKPTRQDKCSRCKIVASGLRHEGKFVCLSCLMKGTKKEKGKKLTDNTMD